MARIVANRRRGESPPRFLVYDDLKGKTFPEGRFGNCVNNLGNGDQGATVNLHKEPYFGFVVFKRLGMANSDRTERRFNMMVDEEARSHMMRRNDREVGLTPELTRHPNIVDFYGYIKENIVTTAMGITEAKTVGLLIEYMPGGSLLDLIRSNKEILTCSFIKRTLLHIARALAYCHEEHNLVHRNVKPSNVLFTRDLKTAKLGDFCYARKVETHQMSAKAGGSLRYIAPEVLLDDHGLAVYGKKADVYSFALVAYAAAHKEEPFKKEEISNQRTFYKQLTDINNPLRPKIDPTLDSEIRSIIERNWINEETNEEGEKVNHRMDMKEIIELLQDMVEEKY